MPEIPKPFAQRAAVGKSGSLRQLVTVGGSGGMSGALCAVAETKTVALPAEAAVDDGDASAETAMLAVPADAAIDVPTANASSSTEESPAPD